jgi:hypothetical protein
MLYKCKCGIIVDDEEKKIVKSYEGSCYGCNTPFKPTRSIKDYLKYFIINLKIKLGVI